MELIKIELYPMNPKGYFEDTNGNLKTIDSNWINKLLIDDKTVTFTTSSNLRKVHGSSIIKINKNAIGLICAYVAAFEEFIRCSIIIQDSDKRIFFLPFFNEWVSSDDDSKKLLRLNAEWIRHMNSLFFQKSKDDSETFFPYEYQDHICHSFVVTLLGKIFFTSVCLHEYVLKAIISSLNDNNSRDDKFKEYFQYYEKKGTDTDINERMVRFLKKKNLCIVINFIYFVKGIININDTEITSDWSKHAWEYIGLWHDSGYDNYTFSFLLEDSFNHNKAIAHLPESFFNCLYEIQKTVIDNLGSLSKDYKNDFIAAEKYSRKNGKNIGAFIKRFEINTNKNYGRAHALFAGFEFLSRYDALSDRKQMYGNLTSDQLNAIAYAIVEHHEKDSSFKNKFDLIKVDSPNDEKNQVNQTVESFTRNPFGHLLRLCDSIAGFARVDIDWSSKLKENKKELKFEYDNDKKIVKIQLNTDRIIPLQISVTEKPCENPTISCKSSYNHYLFAKVETKSKNDVNET